MRRILITGGAGFVGVNLVAHLRTVSELEISVIDNLSLGRREHLEPFGVHFVEGDVRRPADLAPLLAGVDAVVHLAADTRVIESIADPRLNFEVNVLGTFNLLEACRSAGVARLVFASTGGAIIGPATPPVHEEMVPRPVSPYGASKLAGEGYLSAFAGSYGMHCCALRFSNVYGPRSFHKGSVVAQFYRNIRNAAPLIVYGDGSQTRDFVYVDDISAGIWRALQTTEAAGVFQLGSGLGTSVNELLALMRQTVPPGRFPKVEYRSARSGEIEHTFTDIRHARESLGYAPAIVLKEGLARTWAWFEARPT